MTLSPEEITNLRSLISFAKGNGTQLNVAWNETADALYAKLETMRDLTNTDKPVKDSTT